MSEEEDFNPCPNPPDELVGYVVSPNALLPTEEKATPDQVNRANQAVLANLNADGSSKYESAQGYACALTAIMQTDAMRALANPDEGARP